jgi:hypothetical protein
MTTGKIEVTCPCGRIMNVAAEHAGKKARCPGCQEAVFIPFPEPVELPPEQPPDQVSEQSVQTKKCPFCAETILPSAVKCKHCGEDLKGATKLRRPARARARRDSALKRADTGGTDIFVYGLLGWLLCFVFGIVAWVRGNGYLRLCQARKVQPNGLAVAGRIMGMIQTFIFLALIALYAFAVLFSVAM